MDLIQELLDEQAELIAQLTELSEMCDDEGGHDD